MLDDLPWHDIGPGCPHDATGWTWVGETSTHDAGVRCGKCMQLVRYTSQRVDGLARTVYGGFISPEIGPAVWLALFEHDAALTSAALCIASLICAHVDGIHSAERVDAVAAELIRRHPDQPVEAIRHIIERKMP